MTMMTTRAACFRLALLAGALVLPAGVANAQINCCKPRPARIAYYYTVAPQPAPAPPPPTSLISYTWSAAGVWPFRPGEKMYITITGTDLSDAYDRWSCTYYQDGNYLGTATGSWPVTKVLVSTVFPNTVILEITPPNNNQSGGNVTGPIGTGVIRIRAVKLNGDFGTAYPSVLRLQ